MMDWVRKRAMGNFSERPEGRLMSFRTFSNDKLRRYLVAGVSLAALALLVPYGSRITAAQEPKKMAPMQVGGGGDLVARGKYIVEDVAMCGTCHTPRLSNGQLDRSRWLAGAPVPYLPAQPTPDWPINEPRLAGTPPATDVGMITLLTTAVWTDGHPLRDPMPKFHMTPADAQAVVAYLKSLR
jgi:mono/diheme cytochrome c family protein